MCSYMHQNAQCVTCIVCRNLSNHILKGSYSEGEECENEAIMVWKKNTNQRVVVSPHVHNQQLQSERQYYHNH